MRILVTAIRPSEQSVQPPGIHLRWALPSQSERTDASLLAPLNRQMLGFPEKGFSIYRRKHGVLKPTKLSIPRIEKGDTPQSIPSSNHAILFPDPTTRLISDGDQLNVLDGGQLLIRFLMPVVFCEIEFIGANGDNEIKAYRGRNHLSSNQTSVVSGRLGVMGAYFDHVLVTLNFEHIKHITFVAEKDYCNEPDWVSVAELGHLYPGQLEDALKRLEQGLQNRYASSRKSAIKKYSPHVEELLIRLNSILETNVDATLTPENHIGDCPNGVQVSELSTRNLLLSIASDPNLAKIMGLYWVDQFDAPNHPKIGQNYDYKVEGRYGGEWVSGLAINVGTEEAPLPTVPDLKSVEQLPGFRWNNRSPLARVGVDWEKIRDPEPTSTILYDVYRQKKDDEKFTRLTESTPVPVQPNGQSGNGQSSHGLPRFVDQDVPLGAYAYQISGIDIFGQESIHSEPQAVRIVDQAPPPPPVHLRCSVAQPGYPWRDPDQLAVQIKQNDLDINTARIRMSFEYGHAQHRQAPDATYVRLYWRQDDLRINRGAKVIQVVRQSVGNGLVRLKVKLDGIDDDELDGLADGELELFDGGVLLIKTRQGQDLPNSQRTPMRIERIESNQIVLRPSTIQLLVEDRCKLTSDVHNRENWQPFGDEIKIQKPLQGKVLEIRDLHVRAGGIHKITSQDAASAAGIANTLPGGLRPEDTAKLPPVTELLIDRDLLESDLFSDGLLIANENESVPIIYSTAGIAYSSQSEVRPSMISRIGIAPSDSHVVEKTISLASPEKFDRYGDPVRFVVKEVVLEDPATEFEMLPSGGEIVFEWEEERCGEKEAAAVIARVVSSIRKEDDSKISLLINIRKSDWDNYGETGYLVDKSTASYYAPYLVQPFSASIARNGDSPGAPGWRWSSASGVLKGYIAATAYDDRSNEGPLSHPIEASAFKPPPTGKPNPPIPCSLEADIDKAYASPPDLDGKATVCLQWPPAGIDSTEGLRCEIARALDATIIKADKKNWLLGLHEPGFPAIEIDILSVRDPNTADGDLPADVVVVQFKPENEVTDESLFVGGVFAQNDVLFSLTAHKLTKTVAGNEVTFEASVKPPAGAILNTAKDAKFCRGGIVADQGTSFTIGTPETSLHNGQVLLTIDKPGEIDLSDPVVQTRLVGGRLSTASGSSTNHFKISKISLDRDTHHKLTGRICLLLQPQIGNRTQIGAQVTICSAPNYDLAKPNDGLLRELADNPSNISAFGVVTGTPVKPAANAYLFRDQFLGIGSNRYFYKARGKDSSENNTRWSSTSMPFYQVDTSAPQSPSGFRVTPGDRVAFLTWQRINDSNVAKVNIYRIDETETSPQQQAPDIVFADVARSQTRAPLRILGGSIQLPFAVSVESPIEGVKVISNSDPNMPIDFFIEPEQLTHIDNRIIKNLNPLVQEQTRIVAIFEENNKRSQLTRRPGSGLPLEVQNHSIDLGFDLEVSEIVGLYNVSDLDDSPDLDQIEAPNLINLMDASIDPSALTISGFSSSGFDGIEVVAVLLLNNGQKTMLKHKPGTLQPLEISGDILKLDLDLQDQDLVKVHPLPLDLNLDVLDGLPDLMIKTSSKLIRSTDDFHRIQRIVDLNPLAPSGVTVRIIFNHANSRDTKIDANPLLEQWVDESVQGGRKYRYWISATRDIKGVSKVGDQTLSVESKLSEPDAIVAIDRSELLAPAIQEVVWEYDPIQVADPIIKIVISTAGPLPHDLLVEFSKDGGGIWNKATLVSGFGWIAWPAADSPAPVRYRPTSTGKIYFRARIRSGDNRVSRPSPAVLLEPFTEDAFR